MSPGTLTSHRWSRPGVPQRGWTCTLVADLGDAVHTCEMCGKEEIRYVHTVAHQEHEALQVGCVCVEKMTDDYAGPKKREAALRGRAARRAKWLTRRWRVSRAGNEFLNLDGINLGVVPGRFGWRFRTDGTFSKQSYDTSDEAKLALFDYLNPSTILI